MSDLEIIEAAIDRVRLAYSDLRSGTLTSGPSIAAIFLSMVGGTVEQLELAAEQYRETPNVACDHCWVALSLAKDVMGIHQEAM